MVTPQPAASAGLALGVDLGGTSGRVGLVSLGDGTVRARDRFETGRDADPDAVIAAIADSARALCERAGTAPQRLAAAGVGAPGPLDPYAGVVHGSPNLPRWRDVPLAARLTARLGRTVTLQNDACCAAWGEYRFGAARDAAVACVFTLGTGVGGAVIAHGQLVQGTDGTAGHLGHMHVAADGPACACGTRGCLEAYAAADRIVARHRAAGGTEDTVAAIADLAAIGDARARATFAAVGEALGLVCASLVNALNPDVLVLAGGVAGAFEHVAPAVRAAIDARAFAVPARRARVVRTGLGPDAGVVGAATWATERVA